MLSVQQRQIQADGSWRQVPPPAHSATPKWFTHAPQPIHALSDINNVKNQLCADIHRNRFHGDPYIAPPPAARHVDFAVPWFRGEPNAHQPHAHPNAAGHAAGGRLTASVDPARRPVLAQAGRWFTGTRKPVPDTAAAASTTAATATAAPTAAAAPTVAAAAPKAAVTAVSDTGYMSSLKKEELRLTLQDTKTDQHQATASTAKAASAAKKESGSADLLLYAAGITQPAVQQSNGPAPPSKPAAAAPAEGAAISQKDLQELQQLMMQKEEWKKQLLLTREKERQSEKREVGLVQQLLISRRQQAAVVQEFQNQAIHMRHMRAPKGRRSIETPQLSTQWIRNSITHQIRESGSGYKRSSLDYLM